MKVSDCLTYDETLVNKLKEYDNNTRWYIQDVISQFNVDMNGFYADPSNTFYYSFVDLFEGRILERVFAVRHCRKQTYCKEVLRRLEGLEVCLMKEFYISHAGFRNYWNMNTIWSKKTIESDESKGIIGWHPIYLEYTFNRIYGTKLYKPSDIVELDKSLQYACLDIITEKRVDIIKYISFYRKYPSVEFFVKLDILKLATSVNFMKRIERKDKKFMKYCYKYKQYLNYHTYNEILLAYRNNWHLNHASGFRLHKDSFLNWGLSFDSIDNYCFKNDITVGEFYDHMRLLTSINPKWNKTSLIYPVDFHQAHQEEIKLSEEIKVSEKYSRYLKVRKKAIKKCFIDDEYELIVPETVSDFIDEGRMQNNCVGRNDYFSQMADGKCYIYFLRKKENLKQSFITIEYDPKRNRLVQCYKKENKKVETSLYSYIEEKLCSN